MWGFKQSKSEIDDKVIAEQEKIIDELLTEKFALKRIINDFDKAAMKAGKHASLLKSLSESEGANELRAFVKNSREAALARVFEQLNKYEKDIKELGE